MIQVHKPSPSTWEKLGAGIGQGFNQGISDRLSLQMKKELEEEKYTQKAKLEKVKKEEELKMYQKLFPDKFSTGEGRENAYDEYEPDTTGYLPRETSETHPLAQGKPSETGEEMPQEAPRKMDQPREGPRKQPAPVKQKAKIPGLIPQSDIDKAAILNPALSKSWQEHNKNLIDTHKRDEELDLRRKEFFHNETKETFKDITDKASTARKKNIAIQKQLPLIRKLGFKDKVVSNIFAGTPWENLLKSADAQEFDAYSLPQLEGWRNILGGVLSDSDIRLLMQKVVTASKDPEANEAIADFLMLTNDMDIAQSDIANAISKESGGYRPPGFSEEVQRRLTDQFRDRVESGYNRVMQTKSDPEQVKKIAIRKVSPGTPLNPKAIEDIETAANGDPDEALRLAREAGYDI